MAITIEFQAKKNLHKLGDHSSFPQLANSSCNYGYVTDNYGTWPIW